MTWHLIDRYPHHADIIKTLSETNPGFSALCDDYGRVVDSLQGRESIAAAEAMPEIAELKRRRSALEEELLLTIESNRP